MPNIRPLSPELAEKARLELNEKPEQIDSDLQALRDWLAKSPHIKARTDDQLLVTFLRGSKYSLERAKQKIDSFYTARTAIPEMFKGRDPTSERTKQIIRTGMLVPLPETVTPDGPRLMLFRPGAPDPEIFGVYEPQAVMTMFFDILLREDDHMVVAGVEGICDMKDLTTAHMIRFTPRLMKQISFINQDANPIRQKGNYLINIPGFFMSIFNLFKTFMNEKNRSRINIYGNDIDEIFDKIPRRLLPNEYGGEAGPTEEILKHWEKKFESYAEYFKEEESYGINESKRPAGSRRDAETLFGCVGSFRKLEVD